MNEYNKRILEADLPAKYKDGEVLQHIDMNRLEAITRTGINANYEDIQKIQDGTTSVGNAALFMGNTLSKQEDEPLKDDDTKVSSSKQVKTYVDLEIFNRLQGIEDQFYTKDQINAQQATKVDKVVGKELSTNDFTDALKGKLDGIAEGAEVNVQSDWSAIEGDAFIKNKPTIPTTTNELTNNSGFITATDNITGNANTATTANKTVGKLTIQKNGTNLSTFDGSSNRTVNIDVPIVENSLTSTSSTSALSAKQGRELDLTKQNKLIAGNNITITENTISASEPGVGKSEGPNKGEIFNTYNGIGKNVASGEHSHAEGISTKARGTNSHAEGYATEASAFSAHSEGDGSKALGNNSHSEGHFTEALGDNSHSEGQFVSTDINSSHIGGQFGDITNVDDPDTLFAVANGNGSNDRNIGLKFQGLKGNGKLYVEGNEVATKNDIASSTNLGLVKVGNNLTIDPDGTLNATGGGEGSNSDIILDVTKLLNLKPSSTQAEITEALGGVENEQKLKKVFLNPQLNTNNIKVVSPVSCVNANVIRSGNNLTTMLISFDIKDYEVNADTNTATLFISHYLISFPFVDAVIGVPELIVVEDSITQSLPN